MSEFEKFHMEDHRKLSRAIDVLSKQVEELREFKWRAISAAMTTSVIVSGLAGAVTLMSAVALVYYTRVHG